MKPVFDYFLHHFLSAFEAEGVEIAYGKSGTAKVVIEEAAGGFFDQANPYTDHVAWRPWLGTRIPFFFGNPPEHELLIQENGQVLVQADIVASGFYLLSGWQEFHSAERDQFGRFPYHASVQHHHWFVTVPVVNYYFDMLCAAIEMATGRRPARRFWPQNRFSVCLTHDIDRCESGWKIAGKAALQKGKIARFSKLLWQKARGCDNWFNIAEIATLEEELRARGTYFFLPNSQPYQGHPNADHDISLPKYQLLMRDLQQRGHEVGVHGSFGTSTSAAQLQTELDKLPFAVKGNRFHYLMHDPAQTPAVLEKTGLLYDTSLGFAEHFGFRNSYCLPFRPFDFRNRRMVAYTELPLNLMDTTLRHTNYLMLEPEQILPAVKPMLEQIIRFNGLFTLLWHNEHFTGYHLPGDKEIFVELVEWCKEKGAVFLTGSEAALS